MGAWPRLSGPRGTAAREVEGGWLGGWSVDELRPFTDGSSVCSSGNWGEDSPYCSCTGELPA